MTHNTQPSASPHPGLVAMPSSPSPLALFIDGACHLLSRSAARSRRGTFIIQQGHIPKSQATPGDRRLAGPQTHNSSTDAALNSADPRDSARKAQTPEGSTETTTRKASTEKPTREISTEKPTREIPTEKPTREVPTDTSTDTATDTPSTPTETPPIPPPEVFPRTLPQFDRNERIEGTVSALPSTRLGRMLNYGSMAASLTYAMASHSAKKWTGASHAGGILSESAMATLVDQLARMRGAAMKLGQFYSIQDSDTLPPQLTQILMRLQNEANFMPSWQSAQVLQESLGPDWETQFEFFNKHPFAAASIGQVHKAILPKDGPLADKYASEMPLAVKVQFPTVRESIHSDLKAVKELVRFSFALPRGMFLENSLRVMGLELEDECNYEREAQSAAYFRSMIEDDPDLRDKVVVPRTVTELSRPMVLVNEFMPGESLSKAIDYDQGTRDYLGSLLFEITLKEIFQYKAMQTDPNWGNFLYDKAHNQLALIDFGATRYYTQDFIHKYLAMFLAAIDEDYDRCISTSLALEYLTGEEVPEMVDAHVRSMFALARPFRAAESFDFAVDGAQINRDIRANIGTMLKHRLTPPPYETYSLNRKLSGSYLLSQRLRCSIDTAAIFRRVVSNV